MIKRKRVKATSRFLTWMIECHSLKQNRAGWGHSSGERSSLFTIFKLWYLRVCPDGDIKEASGPWKRGPSLTYLCISHRPAASYMFGREVKAGPPPLREKEVTPPLLSRSLQFCWGNDIRETFWRTGYARICGEGNHCSGKSEKKANNHEKEAHEGHY